MSRLLEEEYSLQDLVVSLINPDTGVEIKNRKYHFRTYKSCFIGKEAVTWIQAHLKCDKEIAIRYGQNLLDSGYISHVVDENKSFKDETLFYVVNKPYLLKELQRRKRDLSSTPQRESTFISPTSSVETRKEERKAFIQSQKEVKNKEEGMEEFLPPLVVGEQLQTHETFELAPQRTQYGIGCMNNNCHSAMMNKWNGPNGDEDISDEQLLNEAKEFLTIYYKENNLSNAELQLRILKITSEVKEKGIYTHTTEEISYGAQLAWRNAGRCINRIQWNNLHLIDKRDVITNEGMIETCFDHIKFATNNGNIISTITVFPPRKRGSKGPRVWNPQLIRYAGYLQEDGSVIGDSANVEFTKVCMKMGWTGKGGKFDVLPLIVQAEDHPPLLREIPSNLILEVEFEHPNYEWFKELGLKWHALPALSNFCLDVGGIIYPAIPFNGWYLGTEIGARNLSDEGRYNVLPEIAKKLNLKMINSALWKDRALLELNLAVLHSFQKNGVTIVDHHTASDSFISHYRKELKVRGKCPGDWVWIVPPLAPSTTQVFHLEMINFFEKPAYLAQTNAWLL